jgi:hypothetical protein
MDRSRLTADDEPARAPSSRPSARDRVQSHAVDVVYAAALFKPNAAGRNEFAGMAGFGHRQLLKARGAFLAERVLIGLTPLHIHALAVHFAGHALREVGCWRRGELFATAVPAVGDTALPPWPALLLTNRRGDEIAELQVAIRNDDAWTVLTQLVPDLGGR